MLLVGWNPQGVAPSLIVKWEQLIPLLTKKANQLYSAGLPEYFFVTRKLLFFKIFFLAPMVWLNDLSSSLLERKKKGHYLKMKRADKLSHLGRLGVARFSNNHSSLAHQDFFFKPMYIYPTVTKIFKFYLKLIQKLNVNNRN